MMAFAAVWLDERGHEVSILMATIGAFGRYLGVVPRAKISMTIMRPPQHGHGLEGDAGSVASAAASSGFALSDRFVLGVGTASSSRALAMFSAREELASRP